MSLHTIKPMLELIPEVTEHVKTAQVQTPYGVQDRETTLLSSLCVEYAKLPGVEVDLPSHELVDRVKTASDLYGLEPEFRPFAELMYQRHIQSGGLTKEASENLDIAQSALEAEFSGMCDLEKTASKCQELYDSFGDSITSDVILKHAGVGYLDKEAAEFNLVGRYKLTRREDFLKVARVVRNTDPSTLTQSDVSLICNTVTGLDKEAGLHGYDFFAECVLTKQADIASALKVKVHGKEVPVERIIAVAPDLVNVLGKDVTDGLSGDPQEVKAVVESLPLDLKVVISRHV